MLPFLKRKEEPAAMGEEDEAVKRKHDESYDMLDAVVEDILDAVERKDKALLKGALEALVEHIQDLDLVQDEQH